MGLLARYSRRRDAVEVMTNFLSSSPCNPSPARELGVDMTQQDWKSLLNADHTGGGIGRPLPSPSPTNLSEVSDVTTKVFKRAAVCWAQHVNRRKCRA